MRISDWSSDVCSSDLQPLGRGGLHADPVEGQAQYFRDPATHRIPMRTDFRGLANQRQVDMFDEAVPFCDALRRIFQETGGGDAAPRSEEHTSELQSLMRISYAVFCLQKQHKTTTN